MRKILLVLLILVLCAALFFVVWYDIPSVDMITTYPEIEEAYDGYLKKLKTLETKNDIELPGTLAKLNAEYTESDTDNVIKKYKDNKAEYEDLLAYQKANAAVGAADIYDVEFIWTNLGKFAQDYGCNMVMKISKSEADLESEDYIMCNLDFEIVGQFTKVAKFLEEVEKNEKIGFQINDFFVEGYERTARIQSKDEAMDTDNIPSDDDYMLGKGNDLAEDEKEEYPLTEDSKERHKFDVKSSFKVYNVPINRRTITNVKLSTETSADESAETSETSETSEEVVE